MNIDGAIEKLVEVLNRLDFEKNLDSCSMIREYATPDYIGNMIRVNYDVKFERNDYFGKIVIIMNAVIFKRDYGETFMSINEGCFNVHDDDMQIDDSIYEYDNKDYDLNREQGERDFIEKCDDLKRKVNFMIELTEKRLKNIFGMVRMA